MQCGLHLYYWNNVGCNLSFNQLFSVYSSILKFSSFFFFKFNSLLLFVFGVIFKVNPNLDRFKTFTLVDPAVTPSTPIQSMKKV